MNRLLGTWFCEDDGQDLVEYSLLLALIVCLSSALFLYNKNAVSTVWGVTNNNLDDAASAAS